MKRIMFLPIIFVFLMVLPVMAEDIVIEADSFVVRGARKDVDAQGNVLMLHKKVKIVGAKANYVQDDKLVTIWENVILTYKNARMTADKIVFDGDTQVAKAYGNVKYYFDQENVKGSSKDAVFYANQEKIVMNGNVVIVQGDDSIVGDIVDIYLGERKIIARGRTSLTISSEKLDK